MPHHIPNKLITETSPYLLQHAYNPVDWHPWGEEALEKARSLNKPILVSIGYSACHWCHVMEKESFENEGVAKLMNDNFINIKIDREERPDLDAIYMDAVQAISGSGGWPLNVFLTPETKPFYGGTYFPPTQAYNRSSWTEVLNGVSQAWHERRHEIEAQAENLLAYMQKNNEIAPPTNLFSVANEPLFTKDNCHDIFRAIMANADKVWGGFGKAPKFPQTFTIEYLLQYHHFTKNADALEQALLSINKMLEGGIYDHLGGGLARYSTDIEWLAPHFEKMLYDNALLINILCDAYQITQLEKYALAIRKTISFLEQELMNVEGGFYAALDADSEGEEGKYYVWQKFEIDAVLGENAAMFCSYFDVSEHGNWEHKNILRVLVPVEEYVRMHNLNQQEFSNTIERCIRLLLDERNKRVKPGLDDKIILSWNALAMHAITKAAAVLQETHYVHLAQNTYRFICKNFTTNDGTLQMYHTYKNREAKYPAFLDDYAYFIQSCIKLYEVTFNEEYLHTATKYCNYVVQNFIDERKLLFYFTYSGQQDIVVRKKEIYDGAIPSANAVMANNLRLLALVNDQADWREQAILMSAALKAMTIKYPTSFGNWAILLLQHVVGINEITISGINVEESKEKLLQQYLPNKILMYAKTKTPSFPIQKDKFSENLTLLYICKDFSCDKPVLTVEELIKSLEKPSF